MFPPLFFKLRKKQQQQPKSIYDLRSNSLLNQSILAIKKNEYQSCLPHIFPPTSLKKKQLQEIRANNVV